MFLNAKYAAVYLWRNEKPTYLLGWYDCFFHRVWLTGKEFQNSKETPKLQELQTSS